MRFLKTMSVVIILTSLMFLLSGCSMFKHLDGSKDSEVLSFHTGEKVNAQGETESMERRRIETEQRAQQQIKEEGEKREQEFSQERSQMQDEIGNLKQQIASLSMENKGLKETQKQGALQNVALSVSIQKSKIKVLSGSGSILSALDMVKKLEAMGYKVATTDMAPTTEFPKDKVFYSKGNAALAKHLAGQISGNAVAAPLTWNSIYDIIVVTRNENFYEDFPDAPK